MTRIFVCFLVLFPFCGYCQKADTFAVHFALREITLSKNAVSYVDSLINKNILAPGQKIMLLGYADYRGTARLNDSISAMRAKNVEAYLVTKKFSEKDIELVAGKGKIERPGMTGKDGFAPDRKVIIIARKMPAKRTIESLDTGQTMVLKNILFYPGEWRLLPSSEPALKALCSFMKENKNVAIQLEGHICCHHIMKLHEELSENRAKAVYEYLVTMGISKERMSYIGYGFLHPLFNEEGVWDDDKLSLNRRVEVRILRK